jgi:hypothetical protein
MEEQQESLPISDKVNQSFAAELQGMGFTKEVSENALFLTQSSSLEAAMNWIEQHQGDEDFLEELRIVGAPVPNAPKLTPEEAAAKARELQERLRKKRAEEEKKLELEQERNRLKMGKELNMARQQYEDAEAKRIADARLREKRLQEKELADIKEQVRREKEARFGKAFPSEAKPQLPPRELMVNALKAIKTLYPQHRHPDVARTAMSTLRVYLNNLLASPEEEKFRRIRKDNRAFQDRVAKVSGAINFLKAAGFGEEGDFMVMGALDSGLLAEGVRLLEETLATL